MIKSVKDECQRIFGEHDLEKIEIKALSGCKFYTFKNAIGYHFTLIESPIHNQIPSQLSDAQLFYIFNLYYHISNELEEKENCQYVLTFKTKSLVNNTEENMEYEFDVDKEMFKRVLSYLEETSLVFYYNVNVKIKKDVGGRKWVCRKLNFTNPSFFITNF